MESEPEVERYVLTWHHYFMSPTEKSAQNHLFATMKATMGRSDVAAQEEARQSSLSNRWLSNDPEVLRLTSEGYESFVKRVAARILCEYADKLTFNRCPRCQGLARTPTARQCRFCGHDWH